MSKVERLLGEYRESHQNETNQVIHNIFVPLIYLSVIGLLWDVKLPIELDFLGGEPVEPIDDNRGAWFLLITSVAVV